MTSEPDISIKLVDLHEFYAKYFGYYNTLESQWQALFTKRCMEFVLQKDILGAEGFVPNNQVKAIIAASAVQLTLGLESWSLIYFDTIFVHPTDFDNKGTGQKFRGETNLSGYMRLSWKGFLSGYRISNDNLNLGIHEFAHALKFNSIRGETQDYFIEHYYNKWQAAALEAYSDIRKNKDTIFRKYGGANMNEFLSVCIEHYFESPEQIKLQYPYLYYCTAIFLNQQTQNNSTVLNIRNSLLKQSNSLYPGFSDQIIKTKPLQTRYFTVLKIIFLPLIYTIYITGMFSEPSVFLWLLILLTYLRFDYKFTKIKLGTTDCKIDRGFFIFKKWKRFLIPISSIISLRIYNTGGNDNEWEIVFFNSEDNSFYEEYVSTNQTADLGMVNEMSRNRIAYFSR